MPKAHHAYVNAAQIVVCAPNVSAQLEKDALQSALCAQLLADKADYRSTSDWQHQYSKALLKMLWLRTSFSTAQLNLAGNSQSLIELVRQCLSDPSLRAIGYKVLGDLRRSLNAPALQVLHDSLKKPNQGPHATGIYIEIVLLESEKSIHSLSLTLDNVRLPSTKNWLVDPLVVTGQRAHGYAQLAAYQLQPTYRNLRATVQSKLNDWPDRLTLAILNVEDTVPGWVDADPANGLHGASPITKPVGQLPD